MFYPDIALYDKRDQRDHFKTRNEYYRELISLANEKKKEAFLSELLAEWSYLTLGRRRWLITKEMANILYEIPIDPDMNGISFPYDSWTLCFEKGTKINNIPFKWIRVFSAKSELIKNLLNKNLNVITKAENTVVFQCDAGLNEKGIPEEDIEDPLILYRRIDIKHFNPYSSKGRECDYESLNENQSNKLPVDIHNNIMNITAKICASAMLLYSARPDMFIPAKLTGKERKNWQESGGTGNISRIVFPTIKKVSQSIGNYHYNDLQRKTVANHYRGWVLRTLRHERYKRNADNSFRVILVEPCEINAKEEGIE